MDAELFTEWQRRQGHKVIHTSSSYWHEAGPRVFQAFPYKWLIKPSEQELNHLLVDHGVLAVRYSTPVSADQGKVSYHLVIDGSYDMEQVHKKTRKHVSSGLSQCTIQEIPLSLFTDTGWHLQLDTLKRQGRTRSMNKNKWEVMSKAAEGIPGIEAWGAFVNGQLAAALLTALIDDTCYTLYSLSLQEYMEKYVNHALFYSATREMLQREGINSIFYTVQSLDAPKSVDDFKFRMGFQAVPVRQRVVFHPLFRPFVNHLSHRVISWLLRKDPGSALLAKGEGMIRFYLQGKQPLLQQELPECLLPIKETLLSGQF